MISLSLSRAMLNAKRSGLVLGIVVIGALGAADPSTQPAGVGPGVSAPAVSASAAAASANDYQNSRDRNNRRNRDRTGRDRTGSGMTVSSMDPYAAIRTRSIFVKGDQKIASENNSARQNIAPSGSLDAPEASLIFNGVIMVGDEANALIENTRLNSSVLVTVGTPISVGRVSAITFEDLSYDSNGKTHHIAIGQDLAGETPSSSGYAATPLAPPATPTGPPGVTGGPTTPAAPAASGGSGSSPEEILARLKAKRNQELGIK
jgi:hypothetical protein